MADVNNGAYAITGSYFSDGSARTVPVGFPLAFISNWTPDFLWINGTSGCVKTPEMSGANSVLLIGAAATIADGITALGNGSFTVGTNAAVSTASQYPYLALRSDAGGLLASVFETGSFVGTGGSLDVATPFTPEMTVVWKPGGGYTHRWRSTAGNTGTNSVPWPGGAVTTIDITAIGANSFTVGTGASVLGVTDYWWIWKVDGAFGTLGDTDLPPNDGGGGDGGGGGGSDGTLCGGGGMHVPVGTIGGHVCTDC
jgi:hypothetical protein